MPHNADAERLIVATLLLEEALRDEDWRQVAEVFAARDAMIDACSGLSGAQAAELRGIEDRILSMLQHRLGAAKADLRNVSAAIRTAGTTLRARRSEGLSLAS